MVAACDRYLRVLRRTRGNRHGWTRTRSMHAWRFLKKRVSHLTNAPQKMQLRMHLSDHTCASIAQAALASSYKGFVVRLGCYSHTIKVAHGRNVFVQVRRCWTY